MDATGQVVVDAGNENDIDSIAVAAAISLAGSGAVGISGAGTGAVSQNVMNNSVEASIKGGSDVDAGTGVDIDATDASAITRRPLAASVAVAASGSVAASVAVAVTIVEVDYGTETRALIAGSDVTTTTGNVTVDALSTGLVKVEGSASA